MKAEKIREALGQVPIAVMNANKGAIPELLELERLAEIGRATEKAFEGIYSELLIHDIWPSGDCKSTETIGGIDELLEWHRAQEAERG